MLKKLLIIIMILIPNIVNAEECSKKSLGYIKEDRNYLIDYNDYKIERTPWTLGFSENSVENRTVYEISEVEKVRYIHISKLRGLDSVMINEIIIKENNQIIDYQATCENCSENFESYIKDGNLKQENSYMYLNGYLKLDLKDYYSLEELNIELYFTDYYNVGIGYEMATSKEDDKEKIYTEMYELMYFISNDKNPYFTRKWDISRFLFRNPEFTEPIISELEEEPTKFKRVIPKNQYIEENILYNHYEYVCEEITAPIIEEPNEEVIEEPKEEIIDNKIKEEIIEKPVNDIKIIKKEPPVNNEITKPKVEKTVNTEQITKQNSSTIKAIKEKEITKQDTKTYKNSFSNFLILILLILLIIYVKNRLFSRKK